MRAGLTWHVAGHIITRVEVLNPRPLRHQDGGAQAFVDQLTRCTLAVVTRRGKFLWSSLNDGRVLLVHLGMNGQLLVRSTIAAATLDTAPESHRAAAFLTDPDTLPDGRPADLSTTEQPHYMRNTSISAHHLRMCLHLSAGLSSGSDADSDDDTDVVVLDPVDQRMLGGLRIVDLTPTANDAPGGMGDPRPLLSVDATHIARDLLDPALRLTSPTGVVARVHASRRAIKAQLFSQELALDISNVYADKGLWEVGVHSLRPGTGLNPRVVTRILESTAEVTRRALGVGGTSSDALYVGVKGAAGFFTREPGTYGRQGSECRRCKATMMRETLGGRSHTYYPRCQTRPRRHRQAPPVLVGSLHDSITAELPGL